MNLLAAAGSVALYALDLLLFLLPGFAVTIWMAVRRRCSAVPAVMLTIVLSAALGYIAFWIYFGSRAAGRILSWTVIASALFVVLRLLREAAVRHFVRGMLIPFGYVLATGIFYSCLLFLSKNPFTTGAEYANDRFFRKTLPGDNQIPLIFAERIYARQPVRPFCCNDWLSSDRPPLQAGIFLLQRPLKPFGNVRLNYELVGIGLQCLWICGVWVLLETIRAPARRKNVVLGFLIFSGFLFYNSVYVWPKLLAATFVLFVLSILLNIAIEKRPLTWFEVALASASFALALLAHPGSAFSAPGLACVAIWNRRYLSMRKILAAVFILAFFGAPWIAYQKFYDPPGNRLLKMHLAGVGPIDSRSSWDAIRDTYRSLGAKTIFAYKWANLRTLIGPHPFLVGRSEEARIAQREYFWNALGVLNVGWLVVLVRLARKTRVAFAYSGWLIGIALLNLLMWSLVLIGPGYTLTAHGSYADYLLLSVGLLGFVMVLPRWIVAGLFTVQLLNLFAVWALGKPSVF